MTIDSNDTPSKRGRGRPRLQSEPCTVRIGVPLTRSDNQALEGLVDLALAEGRKLSKQEIIRQLIRNHGLQRAERLQG